MLRKIWHPRVLSMRVGSSCFSGPSGWGTSHTCSKYCLSCQLESEKQRLVSEYESYKEDKERKVEIISAELSQQQEHCATQTKQLLAENTKLKRKLAGKILRGPQIMNSLCPSWRNGFWQSRNHSESWEWACLCDCTVISEQGGVPVFEGGHHSSTQVTGAMQANQPCPLMQVSGVHIYDLYEETPSLWSEGTPITISPFIPL